MKVLLLILLLFTTLNLQAEVAGEVGVYSDFIWRGTTFSENKPAVQIELDYEHESGFYLGAFGSNASFSDEAMGKASTVTHEVDFIIGKRWYIPDGEIQLSYAQFLFPQAHVFNTDEFNIIALYQRFFIELSYMDDYFGYQSNQQYYRLGYKQPLRLDLEATLSIGYNVFSSPKGKIQSRCLNTLCTEEAFTTTGAGNPNYMDIYLSAQKLLRDNMLLELGINWTDRREYFVEETKIKKAKANDFALVVAILIPFNL